MGGFKNTHFGWCLSFNAVGNKLLISDPYSKVYVYEDAAKTSYVNVNKVGEVILYELMDYERNIWLQTDAFIPTSPAIRDDLFGFHCRFSPNGKHIVIGSKFGNTGQEFVRKPPPKKSIWGTIFAGALALGVFVFTNFTPVGRVIGAAVGTFGEMELLYNVVTGETSVEEGLLTFTVDRLNPVHLGSAKRTFKAVDGAFDEEPMSDSDYADLISKRREIQQSDSSSLGTPITSTELDNRSIGLVINDTSEYYEDIMDDIIN